MVHEQTADVLGKTGVANTSGDASKRRKSESVIQTMENGGQISWTKTFGSDQNLAGCQS